MTYCAECLEEYDPVEYNQPSLDPDEPRFCSYSCEELYACQAAYDEARGTGAPVF